MLDVNLIVIAIGGFVTFFAFLYSMFAGKKSSKESNSNPNEIDGWKHNIIMEQALIKEQIDNIRKEVDGLKKNIHSNDEKTIRSLERFEHRIEKFTDIIIEHLGRD